MVSAAIKFDKLCNILALFATYLNLYFCYLSFRVSVSRAIRPFGNPGRPDDWFSQKVCSSIYMLNSLFLNI